MAITDDGTGEYYKITAPEARDEEGTLFDHIDTYGISFKIYENADHRAEDGSDEYHVPKTDRVNVSNMVQKLMEYTWDSEKSFVDNYLTACYGILKTLDRFSTGFTDS